MLKKKILMPAKQMWRGRKYVDIDDRRVNIFAQKIAPFARMGGKHGSEYLREILRGRREDVYNFLFLLRVADFSLNFNKEYSYGVLLRHFRRIWERGDFLRYAEKVSLKEFRSDLGLTEPLHLSRMRLRALKEAMLWLRAKWRGNFFNFWKVHQNPQKFALGLCELASFRDFYKHNRRRIYILKPNQLLYLELVLAVRGSGYGHRALKDLIVFADTVLPAALHAQGVLKYGSALEKKIERGVVLRHGNREEMELRIGTIIACERIAEIIGAPSWVLDQYLWHRFHARKLRLHKTKTLFY